jgi:hypothetical protein
MHLYTLAVIYRHVQLNQGDGAVSVRLKYPIVPKENRPPGAINSGYADIPTFTHCRHPFPRRLEDISFGREVVGARSAQFECTSWRALKLACAFGVAVAFRRRGARPNRSRRYREPPRATVPAPRHPTARRGPPR